MTYATLVFVLAALTAAFAAPEAHRSIAQSNAGQDRQTFSVQDRQASAAQVCDDPCLLCDLLMEHMLKDVEPRIMSDSKHHMFGQQQHWGKRNTEDESTCLDVCLMCSSARKNQAVAAAILQKLLSKK